MLGKVTQLLTAVYLPWLGSGRLFGELLFDGKSQPIRLQPPYLLLLPARYLLSSK